jgi:hypothetical protein
LWSSLFNVEISMSMLSRRAFIGASVGGLSVLRSAGAVSAVLRCEPISPPYRLVFDCSAANNLKLFLQNEDVLGLVGLVCVKPIRGYAYGAFLLSAWLKPSDRPTKPFPNVLRPIGIPIDEQFCVYGLRAPTSNFIGFLIDRPVSGTTEQLPWYSNVDNIMGGSVSIDWVSINLNQPWFAGSRWIPDDKTCDGMYWRALVIDALRRAAAMPCA